MTMELKIISPSEDGFIKAIEFNFEELKGELAVNLEKYQGLVFTEDTMKDAKADKAKLNKLVKALVAKRIEIKKLCLEPYNKFEAQIKELVALIDDPLKAIDSQVKAHEQKLKDEKQAEIETLWNEHKSSVKALVKLDRIFDQRWLNKGYAISKIKGEIESFFTKTEAEYTTIEELKTEFEDQVIRVYLRTFSIADALAENKKLLEQKAKREEFKRQQEEARAKAMAAAPRPVQPAPTQAPVQPPEPEAVAAPIQEEPVFTVSFQVTATRDQLNSLKAFMNSNGIKFGPVPTAQRAA